MTTKAKCESIFRVWMTLCTRDEMNSDEAQAKISEDLGLKIETVRYALHRAIVDTR
jgi:hypothetical protein